MSSDSFTSELVQLAGVEQQVETNSKLSSLISLNESGQLSADSALVGSQATANSTTLPLQNSSATLNYKGSSGQTVAIARRGDVCPQCGGFQLQPTGGQELRVLDMMVGDD